MSPLPIAALVAAAHKRALLDDGNLARLERRLQRDGVATLPALRQWLTAGDINPKVGAVLLRLLPRRDDLIVGGCHVLAQLAEGGMGRVDLVDHDGALRVLKTLPGNRSGKTQSIRRFRREATLTATLDHPHLVRCHAHGEDQGHLFLVLEFVPGGDVQQLLDRTQRLTEHDALTVIRQTALGLAHAHDRNLIHRDVKPANLFIAEDGHVLVADFGLARPTDDESSLLTAPGGAVGTPCYMAPEQIRGAHLDARCDLYALGCVLHACLAGKPPWQGALHEVIRGHLGDAMPDLRRARADVGEVTLDLHQRLLAKDPARRIATAAEVAELAAIRLVELGGASSDNLERQIVVHSTRHRASLPAAARAEVTVDTQTDDHDDAQRTDRFERADALLVGDLATALAAPDLTLHRADGSLLAQLVAARSLTIGRGDDVAVDLDEAGHGISRHHARLTVTDTGSVVLEDLLSANGTWLDGRWLAPGHPTPISAGRHRLVLADHATLDLYAPPQRTPTTRLSDTDPGEHLGVEHDTDLDALVLSGAHLAAPVVLVLRRVVLSDEGGDLPGPHPESPAIELARHQGRWLLRARPAPWQPLTTEALLAVGLHPDQAER